MTATYDPSIKVRKGDLILVERIHHDFVIGQGSTEYATYTFGVVASATRDGVAKTWHSIGWGDALVSDGHAEKLHGTRLVNQYWTFSAKAIDVGAVLRDAKAHHWPGHPGQPKAFDTKREAQAVAHPHVRWDQLTFAKEEARS